MNRQGKTRLAKYYVPLEESEKHKVEYEVHRLVVNRDSKFTNFVESGSLLLLKSHSLILKSDSLLLKSGSLLLLHVNT
ncbi:hypothetical protein F2Q69_00041444 [Brassica cretica]|uniref:AP complex mu/sigma subunit domain-containing protein n=1 Tax=Brassica cretica TaxID=69181 RepID=A0A8S9NQD4_BRACR|nr:hypothetical protein F2Q69_00041444 [Brassica cretica]